MTVTSDFAEVVALYRDGRVLIQTVEVARSLFARMRGLLGRDSLPSQHGMWIVPCPSVHTFCMQFDLDLIFVDRESRIVNLIWGVPPNRVATGGAGAHSVIEVASGWMQEGDLSVGDALESRPHG